MRLLKLLSVLVVIAGIGVFAMVVAPSVSGQRAENPWTGRELTILSGRGAEIGVSVHDVESAEKGPAPSTGVFVEDVRPSSPADKAGVKRSDVIVEFDGEHVRSARQFTRLVHETAPGRAVKMTIVREGQRRDLQVTPTDDRSVFVDGDRLRDRFGDLERLYERMPPLTFNFDWDLPGIDARGRLGVTVEPLTSQLANYFGAKEGVLVAAVTDDSPAARAGIKAGDVITRVGGDPIRSREDLVRAMRDARDEDQVSVGIVRDKKESTITVKIEPRRPARRGQPAL